LAVRLGLVPSNKGKQSETLFDISLVIVKMPLDELV